MLRYFDVVDGFIFRVGSSVCSSWFRSSGPSSGLLGFVVPGSLVLVLVELVARVLVLVEGVTVAGVVVLALSGALCKKINNRISIRFKFCSS